MCEFSDEHIRWTCLMVERFASVEHQVADAGHKLMIKTPFFFIVAVFDDFFFCCIAFFVSAVVLAGFPPPHEYLLIFVLVFGVRVITCDYIMFAYCFFFFCFSHFSLSLR